ncbi:FAD-dependent oxidoreductase [Hyphomonas sp. WL0036]|uniref:NAD(P)/FAD-dependent oxidoreductase n=1 Tax=Hyphomonas sediminis TaxID=2866160 RepID=UPI001C7E68DD|nr:FAD-dependent oxidoreductase [Hyphomonas sediminis]MBY9067601.1 FAD-dependent oxidoreductase [Hyphomonas sediminis]
MKKIAIIGAGISGLGAAWALKDHAHVTVFEQGDRPGGHACTHTFDYDGHKTSVDLGFIVYNGLNYPNLIAFFDELGVETQASDMSFAVSDPSGWEWASTLPGLFSQKRNLLNPDFHRFWRTILKFNDKARAELTSGAIQSATLGGWLDRHGFDETFRQNYILPMGAAIWSTPERDMLNYPAQSFFQFFDNHRLMHKERPKWRTVTGGSQSYVTKVAAALGNRLRTGVGVSRMQPFGSKVSLTLSTGQNEVFDDVILAAHSDQALALTEDSFQDQAFLLRSVRYRPNSIWLHRDPALMPKRRSAWASWNVLKQEGEDVCLTYWMNRLQGLDPDRPLFITLNPACPPRPELTFHHYVFDHPQFDAAAEAAVRALKRIQGKDNIWFAGAWMGRGFHEDGLKSGLAAGLALGGQVSWNTEGVETYTPRKAAVESHSVEVVA